jgi:hypothetical protein
MSRHTTCHEKEKVALAVRWIRCLSAGLIVAATIIPSSANAEDTKVTATIALIANRVKVSAITPSRCRISWVTNGEATSQVFFDVVEHEMPHEYSWSTVLDDGAVFRHSMFLSELMPGKTYHFRVKSTAGDLTAVSDDSCFTTKDHGQSRGKGWKWWIW